MRVYLASPNSQLQAHAANGMDVLISYAIFNPWMADYAKTYDHLLIDSGAYSVFSSGVRIDALEYKEWHEQWDGMADAVAGLDDIDGDWRKSLKNYELGLGFPTYHDTDPPELLCDTLIPMAKDRGNWIGIGLQPPRHGKRQWLQETLAEIPEELHVHGWALRQYADLARIDSVDSTNWWRDGFKLKTQLPYLTYGECLDIIVKRYQREPARKPKMSEEPKLF
jgi:hypothetical protein